MANELETRAAHAELRRILREQNLPIPGEKRPLRPPPLPRPPAPVATRRRQWPWFVLQGSICIAMLAADMKWHWVPAGNAYVGMIATFVVCLLVTVAASATLDFFAQRSKQ
jgi:hypothetical protein